MTNKPGRKTQFTVSSTSPPKKGSRSQHNSENPKIHMMYYWKSKQLTRNKFKAKWDFQVSVTPYKQIPAKTVQIIYINNTENTNRYVDVLCTNKSKMFYIVDNRFNTTRQVAGEQNEVTDTLISSTLYGPTKHRRLKKNVDLLRYFCFFPNIFLGNRTRRR